MIAGRNCPCTFCSAEFPLHTGVTSIVPTHLTVKYTGPYNGDTTTSLLPSSSETLVWEAAF
jgi:hypothetical protein